MTSARRLLLLSLPALLLSACAPGESPSTTAPEMAPGHPAWSSSGASPDVAPLATFDRPPSITIAWAKKWIGPEGGRLDFHGFAVDVPAGAVDRRTAFSIRLPVDPQGAERVMAEFGPHGATFALPVHIELPYTGTSIFGSESATVVWWNPDAAVWEDVGAVPTADGLRLRTGTAHFSTYGTTESRGGSILVSGG